MVTLAIGGHKTTSRAAKWLSTGKLKLSSKDVYHPAGTLVVQKTLTGKERLSLFLPGRKFWSQADQPLPNAGKLFGALSKSLLARLHKHLVVFSVHRPMFFYFSLSLVAFFLSFYPLLANLPQPRHMVVQMQGCLSLRRWHPSHPLKHIFGWHSFLSQISLISYNWLNFSLLYLKKKGDHGDTKAFWCWVHHLSIELILDLSLSLSMSLSFLETLIFLSPFAQRQI